MCILLSARRTELKRIHPVSLGRLRPAERSTPPRFARNNGKITTKNRSRLTRVFRRFPFDWPTSRRSTTRRTAICRVPRRRSAPDPSVCPPSCWHLRPSRPLPVCEPRTNEKQKKNIYNPLYSHTRTHTHRTAKRFVFFIFIASRYSKTKNTLTLWRRSCPNPSGRNSSRGPVSVRADRSRNNNSRPIVWCANTNSLGPIGRTYDESIKIAL